MSSADTMHSMEQIMGLCESHLVDCGEHHKLSAQTRTAFLAMAGAAKADGIGLDLVSSFRSYQRQLSIWQRKWAGELPLNTLDGEQLNPLIISDEEKLHAILLWSAFPGASRHHWGTDMDVFDMAAVSRSGAKFHLEPWEYEPMGPCYELSQWLDANLARFGFYRPYASYCGGVAAEPWHISYQPEAERIIRQLDGEAILEQGCLHEVAGMELISSQWHTLYRRYVLNQGE